MKPTRTGVQGRSRGGTIQYEPSREDQGRGEEDTPMGH